MTNTDTYYTLCLSSIGEIAICASKEGITALAFQQGAAPLEIPSDTFIDAKSLTAINKPESEKQSAFLIAAVQQLEEYFSGERTEFSLTLAPQGTEFQKKVWQALTQIPFGETVSYGWLAKKINNEKAVRAVGTANGANPIALIVPCHRVIGANKKLTGYAGGLALKAKLLMHEEADFRP